jgi:methyl-accepting chemotaxis protein
VLKDISIRQGLKLFAIAIAMLYIALGIVAYSGLGTLGEGLDSAAGRSALKMLQERIVATVLLGLAAVALGAWLVDRHFARRVDQLVIATEIFSAGDSDLTRRFPRMTGAFGRVCSALNSFIGRLHDLVSNVADNAGDIARTARQISAENAELAARTEQQSATLSETASSMVEFTRSAKESAENVRVASRFASTAAATAKEGGAVVSRAVAMINAANEGSRKIGAIVSTIDTLAFQTNILALNAAVEAARAGEQGRGFAVVAAEVRALAQSSASAAKEIKTLVGAAIEQVDEGAQLAVRAGSSMDEIVVAIQQASDIMAGIDGAASEQASGIERVNRSIAQMVEVTRRNAALVKRGTAGAEAMRAQAEELSDGVARFKRDGRAHVARDAGRGLRDLSGSPRDSSTLHPRGRAARGDGEHDGFGIRGSGHLAGGPAVRNS